MGITRDRSKGKLKLSQEEYVEKILRSAWRMQHPLAAHLGLSAAQAASSQEEQDYMSKVPYSLWEV